MKKQEKKQKDARVAVRAVLFQISFFLELAIAFLLIVLIVAQVIGLGIDMFGDVKRMSNSEHFTFFLETCMNIVIGVEFLKMLCRHNIDVVVDVLLFTLARHMIVGEHRMVEGLLCVISIAILFIVRRFLFMPRESQKMKNPLFTKIFSKNEKPADVEDGDASAEEEI